MCTKKKSDVNLNKYKKTITHNLSTNRSLSQEGWLKPWKFWKNGRIGGWGLFHREQGRGGNSYGKLCLDQICSAHDWLPRKSRERENRKCWNWMAESRIRTEEAEWFHTVSAILMFDVRRLFRRRILLIYFSLTFSFKQVIRVSGHYDT